MLFFFKHSFVGSSSFQHESLLNSFERLPEPNVMENSNTSLREPLLLQRNKHSHEENDENEYWGNLATDIVEHAKIEKTDDGSTFLRASLNGMNVLAGRYLITLVSYTVVHMSFQFHFCLFLCTRYITRHM